LTGNDYVTPTPRRHRPKVPPPTQLSTEDSEDEFLNFSLFATPASQKETEQVNSTTAVEATKDVEEPELTGANACPHHSKLPSPFTCVSCCCHMDQNDLQQFADLVEASQIQTTTASKLAYMLQALNMCDQGLDLHNSVLRAALELDFDFLME
jgi:hypothetical protein